MVDIIKIEITDDGIILEMDSMHRWSAQHPYDEYNNKAMGRSAKYSTGDGTKEGAERQCRSILAIQKRRR
jgi:hypothetical protein